MLTKVVGWKDITYKIKYSYIVFICCAVNIFQYLNVSTLSFSLFKKLWQKTFLYVGGHQTVLKELGSETGLRLIRARLTQSERIVSNQCQTVLIFFMFLYVVLCTTISEYVYHATSRHDWLTQLIESKLQGM